MFGYFFDKLSQAFQMSVGANIGAQIMNTVGNIGAVFQNPLPSFNPIDLFVGAAGGVIVKLIIYVKGKNAKKYRKGCEYGSARWGNNEDIKPYMDTDFQKNVILTETERLTMDGRPKSGPKYARNKNVLVIGGSGLLELSGCWLVAIPLPNELPTETAVFRGLFPTATKATYYLKKK